MPLSGLTEEYFASSAEVWYPIVVEQHIAIVHSRISVLWTNVADDDTFEGLVCLHVSNLHNELMWTM